MEWCCSICGRTFQAINQPHSCLTKPVESHFENKNPSLWQCYIIIKELITAYIDVREISTGSALLYKVKSNFLALKPSAKYIQIEIILSERKVEFPVYKLVQVSKFKYAHFIRIESPDEIDQQLKKWIIQSYQENAQKLQ